MKLSTHQKIEKLRKQAFEVLDALRDVADKSILYEVKGSPYPYRGLLDSGLNTGTRVLKGAGQGALGGLGVGAAGSKLHSFLKGKKAKAAKIALAKKVGGAAALGAGAYGAKKLRDKLKAAKKGKEK